MMLYVALIIINNINSIIIIIRLVLRNNIADVNVELIDM